METITVPQKVYEQMEEIKDRHGLISNCFAIIRDANFEEFEELREWLYSDSITIDVSCIREKQFVGYYYNRLDVKPEEEKYLVYHWSGIDLYEETILSGLTYESGVTHMDWNYDASDFKPLTKEQIAQFQNDSGIVIPEDWLHEVNED